MDSNTKKNLTYIGVGLLSFVIVKHLLETNDEKEAKSNASGNVKPLTTRQVFAKRWA